MSYMQLHQMLLGLKTLNPNLQTIRDCLIPIGHACKPPPIVTNSLVALGEMVWKPTTYKVISIKWPFESFREHNPKKQKGHSSPSLRLATTPRPRSRDGMGKQVVSK